MGVGGVEERHIRNNIPCNSFADFARGDDVLLFDERDTSGRPQDSLLTKSETAELEAGEQSIHSENYNVHSLRKWPR